MKLESVQIIFDKKSMTQLQQWGEQEAILVQKFYRGYRSRQKTKRLWKNLNERKKIIEELVLTQEKYIHDLSIIISDFQIYLFNNKILTPKEVYILFANIDAIRQLNQQFFVLIHNGFNDYWHYKLLFQEVKKQINFFKIYFEYLNNFTNCMTLLKNLKQNNSKFKQFLLSIKKNTQYNNLDLEDYLIKPVQRLPKYVLLLKLLLKKTPIEHPDYQNIKTVLHCFEEVNSSNNQKLNKMINNFKLTELQKQAKLPFHVTEPGTQFILQENVTILTSYNKIQDAVLYLLNNRVILTKKSKQEQRFLQTINFRYGASIMQNQDQQLYGNCFTLQSIDGDSVTFLCQSQEEMTQIIDKIQEQITLIEKKTYEKYSALQSSNQISESFIRKINRFDLMPEVLVLGTQERTQKMLKYTTYIVEVKIKNVKQKIFLRYKELLQVQQLMRIEFPHIQIKQSLYKTTWLLNHKPKTIQERKMSIQKFLTEVLAKPQIMQSGGRILGKLGLSQDMYLLPDKIKTNDSIVKRSMLGNSKHLKSEVQTKDREGITNKSGLRDTRKSYRLSIFQDLSGDEDKSPRKQSLNENFFKQSLKKRKLNIEEMLSANEFNLGHYTRFSENIKWTSQRKIKVNVFIPWIENSKGLVVKTIEIMQNQRVAVLINKLAKQIGLNYYKDFRLFLQKEYNQRVLDDDEIIGKVEMELTTGKFHLIFKKMIFIDKESEQNEIRNDRLRLKLISSQIIYDVKKSKFRLKYNQFLTLSVLIGIIQHESKLAMDENRETHLKDDTDSGSKFKFECQKSRKSSQMRTTFHRTDEYVEPEYKQLAINTRNLLANSYSSFFQNDKVWIKDFTEVYKSLHLKLRKISRGNSMLMRCSYFSKEEQLIWSGVVELSYIAIIDEIKSNHLYGSMGYVVQISEQFRQVLMQHLQEKETEGQIELDIQTKENRNIWLIVKCNRLYLYSINLSVKLYEICYEDIDKVLCYPSSLILSFKDTLESKICPVESDNETPLQSSKTTKLTLVHSHNSQLLPQSIKLKTTSSYLIKQLISYYRNFNDLASKLQKNQEFTESVIEMIYENQKILAGDQNKSLLITYYEEQCS